MAPEIWKDYKLDSETSKKSPPRLGDENIKQPLNKKSIPSARVASTSASRTTAESAALTSTAENTNSYIGITNSSSTVEKSENIDKLPEQIATAGKNINNISTDKNDINIVYD